MNVKTRVNAYVSMLAANKDGVVVLSKMKYNISKNSDICKTRQGSLDG